MTVADKFTQALTNSQSLLAYVNEQTGRSDTDLGEAIRALADAIGTGGGIGGSGNSKVAYVEGSFNTGTKEEYTVNHNFGTDKIIALCIADGDYVATGNGKRIYQIMYTPKAFAEAETISCDFSIYNNVISNPYSFSLQKCAYHGYAGPSSGGTSLSDFRGSNNTEVIDSENVRFINLSKNQNYKYYVIGILDGVFDPIPSIDGIRMAKVTLAEDTLINGFSNPIFVGKKNFTIETGRTIRNSETLGGRCTVYIHRTDDRTICAYGNSSNSAATISTSISQAKYEIVEDHLYTSAGSSTAAPYFLPAGEIRITAW